MLAGLGLLCSATALGSVLFDRHEELQALRTQVQTLSDRLQATERKAADASGFRTLSDKQAALAADIGTLQKKVEASAAHAAVSKDPVATAPPKDPRVDQVIARLDRIERQLTSTLPTGSLTKDGKPVASAAAPHSKPAKPLDSIATVRPSATQKGDLAVAGFQLRGFDHGFAVVQDRDGLEEVAPGDVIPGAGRVQRIERRGDEWVVVTDSGLITSSDD